MNEYDDEFPTCKKTYATLRLYSNDIDHAEITALLGVEPTDAFSKGQRFDDGSLRKFNGWFLSSEASVDSKDSRRHIDWILSLVKDRSAELIDLQARSVEMDISCFWLSVGQGGPILSPRQMTDLVRLNVAVWWDIYLSHPTVDRAAS